jgi:hypothetical protein
VFIALVAMVVRHAGVLEALVGGVLLATVLIRLFHWQDRFLWRDR